jgi:hypothetical protein
MSASIKPNLSSEQAETADFPAFVVMVDGSLDGWRPTPAVGDEATDTAVGEVYADLAIQHARRIRDPNFVTFIIANIYAKAFRGEISMGPIEQGFFKRLGALAYVGSLN